MDSVVLPGAVAPPPAAPVSAEPTVPSSAPVAPAAPVSTFVTPPAPVAAASPFPGISTTPVAPDTAPAPGVDIAALQERAWLYEQIAPEFERQKQALAQVQQLMAVAQEQAAESDAAQARQTRLGQARQVATNLDHDAALDYMARFHEQEIGQERAARAQQQQQAQWQQQAMIERVTAPLYAQHLATQHGLPPEYAQRLGMLPDGRQMDAYLPVLKREHEAAQRQATEMATLRTQLDQFNRSLQANALAQNGAHVPSGVGVMPTMSQQMNGIEPGSDPHLLSIPGVADFLGFPPRPR